LSRGVPLLPPWYLVIEAAEQWGRPPWEIAGDDNEALWFLRWRFIRNERARVAQKRARDAELQQLRMGRG
jgi:hypothetical protein